VGNEVTKLWPKKSQNQHRSARQRALNCPSTKKRQLLRLQGPKQDKKTKPSGGGRKEKGQGTKQTNKHAGHQQDNNLPTCEGSRKDFRDIEQKKRLRAGYKGKPI